MFFSDQRGTGAAEVLEIPAKSRAGEGQKTEISDTLFNCVLCVKVNPVVFV